MIHYHDTFDQGSEEWDEIRAPRMTASHATAIGAMGAGLKTYAKQIVMREFKIETSSYHGKDMERGEQLEPYAILAYEMVTGLDTREVAFVTNDDFPNSGCSPDALVGDDGGIEAKARNNEKHMALILGETKEIPVNQIQHCLMITARKWWDFISYNENHPHPLFIKRIFPDKDHHARLAKGLIAGQSLIEAYHDQYKNFKNPIMKIS